MTKTIYKLSENLVDPRFNGYRFKRGTKSISNRKNREADFAPDDGRRFNWKPQRLRKHWEVPTLVGPVPPFHDYPCVGMIPCFSKRSIFALEDLLKPNGELLPANTEQGTYYLYNILTVSDALNTDESEMIPLGKEGLAVAITYFSFDELAIEELSIFRIRQRSPEVFVTDIFKQRVEDANLNGFLFEKVWPYKQGVNWLEKAATVRRRIREHTSVLRGESIYLDFYYPEEELGNKERRQLDKIADSIELFLNDEFKASGEYIGTLEWTEDCEGFARFYLSCPSTKRIQKILMTWVEAKAWPQKRVITFRSGNLHDEKVKAKKIEIS